MHLMQHLPHHLRIWRNDVRFTNLRSGHLGISMMDSNTTEYIVVSIIQTYRPWIWTNCYKNNLTRKRGLPKFR